MKQWINRSLAALLALSLLAGCSQTAPGDASSVPQQETSASEAEPTIPEPPQPEPEPVSEPEPERTRTLPGWTLLAGMVGAVALAEGMILYGRRRKR